MIRVKRKMQYVVGSGASTGKGSILQSLQSLQSLNYLLLLCLSLLFTQCDIKNNKVAPDANFARIYDNGETHGSFDPLDIKQTSDGGFLILAATDGWSCYLMKTDKEGKFLWEQKLPSPYVNPVADLMEYNGSFYFFCMDIFSLGTYLLKVNEAGGVPEVAGLYSGTTYPLCGSKVAEGFIVQGYNRDEFTTLLTKIDNSFCYYLEQKIPGAGRYFGAYHQ